MSSCCFLCGAKDDNTLYDVTWPDKTRELLCKKCYEKSEGVRRPAAGPWRTDEPPKDGTWILAAFGTDIVVVRWTGSGYPNGWCSAYQNLLITGQYNPEPWAELYLG